MAGIAFTACSFGDPQDHFSYLLLHFEGYVIDSQLWTNGEEVTAMMKMIRMILYIEAVTGKRLIDYITME